MFTVSKKVHFHNIIKEKKIIVSHRCIFKHCLH